MRATARASVIVPPHAKSDDTLHLILEVNDNGVPSLTRHRRVVITVK